jgi:hypothetical protein
MAAGRLAGRRTPHSPERRMAKKRLCGPPLLGYVRVPPGAEEAQSRSPCARPACVDTDPRRQSSPLLTQKKEIAVPKQERAHSAVGYPHAPHTPHVLWLEPSTGAGRTASEHPHIDSLRGVTSQPADRR